MSRFRPSKGPVLAGLALCLVLAAAICYYHAQQPLSPAAGPAAASCSFCIWITYYTMRRLLPQDRF